MKAGDFSFAMPLHPVIEIQVSRRRKETHLRYLSRAWHTASAARSVARSGTPPASRPPSSATRFRTDCAAVHLHENVAC